MCVCCAVMCCVLWRGEKRKRLQVTVLPPSSLHSLAPPSPCRRVVSDNAVFSQISRYFSQNLRFFSQTFRLFRRRPIRSNLFAGFLRAWRAIGRPMSATRFGDRSLHMILLLHGICTGPANRAPFQSTGPRADIIKLEDRTASRTASLD